MTLSKCAATKLPLERLIDLVPGDGGGGGGNGFGGGGGGAAGVVLRAEKVQVMRRVSKGEGDEKMPRVEVLSLEDEAARLKQKEIDYEAARSREFSPPTHPHSHPHPHPHTHTHPTPLPSPLASPYLNHWPLAVPGHYSHLDTPILTL